MRLKDKVALVTYASSGMSAAIAQGLLKEGAHVVFSDIDVTAAQRVAKELGALENRWFPAYINVVDQTSIEDCIEQTIKQFGRLDILVENAGITLRHPFN